MPKKRNSDEEAVTRGILKEELAIIRQEIRSEFHQVLRDFYRTLLEPQFEEFRGDVRGLKTDFQEFRGESLGRFDDLYKKFDDLKQEYVFANHQLKGIDFRLERLEQRGR